MFLHVLLRHPRWFEAELGLPGYVGTLLRHGLILAAFVLFEKEKDDDGDEDEGDDDDECD